MEIGYAGLRILIQDKVKGEPRKTRKTRKLAELFFNHKWTRKDMN